MASTSSAQVLKDQQDTYNEMYAPLEQQVAADVNSTDIINNARTQIDSGFALQGDREERDRRRYGLNQKTAIQQKTADRSTGMRAALTRTNTMNNAVLNQYSRNTGLRDSMIDVGRGVESQSTQGLIDSDAAASARDTANKNAAAQKKAQNVQTGAALVVTAIIL